MTTSSVSITQGLNNSSKISTLRSLWSLRHQSSRQMLCHNWIYLLTYQMASLFTQFLTRGMHLIFILSIFLTCNCLEQLQQQPQLMVHTSHVYQIQCWACHDITNISSRRSMLADRLFNKGLSSRKLLRPFHQFMGRYPELASKVNKSQSSMICDSVPVAQLYHTFAQLMK